MVDHRFNEVKFFAHPTRPGFELNCITPIHREPQVFATLALDHPDGAWVATAKDPNFQNTLSRFVTQVAFCDPKTAMTAAKLAYSAYFHGEEVDDGPYEEILMLVSISPYRAADWQRHPNNR